MVNGFHKDKHIIGGRVLNALHNNVLAGKEDKARRITELINYHKNSWIDKNIKYRDIFIHPEEGSKRVLFELGIVEENNELRLLQIGKPSIDDIIFDVYANNISNNVRDLSIGFIDILNG